MSLQDDSGLWHTVIDRDDSYLEASSAAGFALALGRATSDAVAVSTRRARATRTRARSTRFASKINAHGAFTGVSQQTPPGDFAFYNSIEIGTAPFATGICMMALSEAARDETTMADKNKTVVVLPGDDAAPEAMGATMDALRALKLPIDYVEFPPGEKWVRGETDAAARKAIDASDTTLFGSTSGKTTAITYLRWGKQTFANVRPVRYSKGFKARSPSPTESTS